MPMSLLSSDVDRSAAERPRRRQTWRKKFLIAFRGIKFGVRGQSSFTVHFFCATGVIMAAGVLGCDRVEWCLLLGCIGLVLTAELFNSSIETLFRGLDETAKERVWPSLDIASAGVLMASITASMVGLIILLPKLIAWVKGIG